PWRRLRQIPTSWFPLAPSPCPRASSFRQGEVLAAPVRPRAPTSPCADQAQTAPFSFSLERARETSATGTMSASAAATLTTPLVRQTPLLGAEPMAPVELTLRVRPRFS